LCPARLRWEQRHQLPHSALPWATLGTARRGGLLVVEGIVGIAAGVVTFLWPDITTLVLLFTIAAWAVLTAIVEIMAAIRLRREMRGEWLLAVSGVLSVVLEFFSSCGRRRAPWLSSF
jgi:uncharacterized membrane protein HdeD (DUF308 family)